jgi:predicted MPP superfamily phosphohydrolase
MEEADITVLRDSYQLIADSFYLVGRDDAHNSNRKELDTVISGIDKSLPVILMDHNPSYLEDGDNAQIDLQLSGHTHQGQFFPLNLVTDKVFEVDWGYLQKDHMQVIVSNGFGTWGPPIRVGNRPEIVEIFIKFAGKS